MGIRVYGYGSKKSQPEEPLASLIPGLSTTSKKRPRTPNGNGGYDMVTFKKLLIPSYQNLSYYYLRESLVGPGGSKNCELIANAGGDVWILLCGKDVPYIVLKGRKSNVDRAEMLVRVLLENSDAANREKVMQLGSMNNSECPRKALKVIDSRQIMTVPS